MPQQQIFPGRLSCEQGNTAPGAIRQRKSRTMRSGPKVRAASLPTAEWICIRDTALRTLLSQNLVSQTRRFNCYNHRTHHVLPTQHEARNRVESGRMRRNRREQLRSRVWNAFGLAERQDSRN